MQKSKPLITIKTYCIIILLLGTIPAFSQETFSSVSKQFQDYANDNYQEKVFLHTDKTVYATGEILWFKGYVLNAKNNSPSLLSKICYVEIINSEKKSLLQAKISIDSGTGNGSFLLPSFLRSGNYILRAYTNWMKNFSTQFYFQQTITIINPGKKPEVNNDTSLAVANISFFPEGGNLVSGIQSTVAFKACDNYGNGLPAQGFIIDQKNDTVIKFETERFGIGTFLFIPDINNKYHAVVIIGNKKIEKDLPEIFANGWVMHLNENNNQILIKASCNLASERNVFLLLQSKNQLNYARSQPIINGEAFFTINKADMPEGISQLTLFNNEKQPVSERLYFKNPTSVLQLKASTDESNYGTRSKVTLDITATDTSVTNINANLGISVYLLDSLQPEQKINLFNYVWLTSELKGNIESPDFYFQNSDSSNKAADNLMLTQGWRRFKWQNVLSNNKPSFYYLPEYEGHIVSGHLIPKTQSLSTSNVSAYLSVVGKNFRFSNTTSQADGRIEFNVQKFYGNRELVIQPGIADSNYHVVMDNPFSDQFDAINVQTSHLYQSLGSSIMQRSIEAQSMSIFHTEEAGNFILPSTYDTTVFYGVPYKSYILDDYTRFPTMEEVMREYVKEVHVKKRDKNFYYEVLNEPYKDYFNNTPLVLIDGVPVWNIDKIIDMDPLKIQKTEVITSEFYQGAKKYDGIVSYGTYNGDLEGYQLDPDALVVEYEGLQLQREFYSPKYETTTQKQSRLPDFRNVLYWSPDILTALGKRKLNFYTSDITGNYLVIVQGISKTGQIGVGTCKFSVKNTNAK